MICNLYYHNGIPYIILRKLKAHSISPKGYLDMELLKLWRDYIGADHVLQKQDEFWLCETVKDAEIIK